jgi:hypothetical protein
MRQRLLPRRVLSMASPDTSMIQAAKPTSRMRGAMAPSGVNTLVFGTEPLGVGVATKGATALVVELALFAPSGSGVVALALAELAMMVPTGVARSTMAEITTLTEAPAARVPRLTDPVHELDGPHPEPESTQ